jgi:four helix bundle protein
MLDIYYFIVDTIRLVAPLVRRISNHDPDLAKQMRRALNSVLLNTAEGVGNHGGHARLRFRTALGSNQEVRACLDAAEAWGDIDAIDAALRDRFDRIAATLYKLAR